MTLQQLVSMYNIKPEHVDALTEYVIHVAANTKRKPGRPKESDRILSAEGSSVVSRVLSAEPEKRKVKNIEMGLCTLSFSESMGFSQSLEGSALVTFTCENFTHSERMNYVQFAELIFDGIEVCGEQVSTASATVNAASSLRMDVLEPMLRNLFLGSQLRYAVQVKRAVADVLCPTELKSVSVVGFVNPDQSELMLGNNYGTTQVQNYS